MQIKKLSKVFKALGSETRLKILFTALKAPRCGKDLADIFGKDASTISRHLKELMDADLIDVVRRGKEVCVVVPKKKLVKQLLEIASKFG